jgi:hypothetical protein
MENTMLFTIPLCVSPRETDAMALARKRRELIESPKFEAVSVEHRKGFEKYAAPTDQGLFGRPAGIL